MVSLKGLSFAFWSALIFGSSMAKLVRSIQVIIPDWPGKSGKSGHIEILVKPVEIVSQINPRRNVITASLC